MNKTNHSEEYMIYLYCILMILLYLICGHFESPEFARDMYVLGTSTVT